MPARMFKQLFEGSDLVLKLSLGWVKECIILMDVHANKRRKSGLTDKDEDMEMGGRDLSDKEVCCNNTFKITVINKSLPCAL